MAQRHTPERPIAASAPNGRPGVKPYKWRGGDPRDAEVRAQLVALRAYLAGGDADLDPGPDGPGPSYEARREAYDIPLTSSALAVSQQARAAIPVPVVIQARVEPPAAIAPPVDVPGPGHSGEGHPGPAPTPPTDVPGQGPDAGDRAPGRAPIIPCQPSGRRKPQPGAVPPSLAARLATWHTPPPIAPAATRRCRRCRYTTARCACPRRGRR
ncbi:MAG TPA: hypothetical protein VH641_14470 [Streptosporangiaceae bacterium]